MSTKLQIERIHELQLTATDEAQIAALLARAFQTADFGGRTYFQNRHHIRIILRENGAAVGHVALSLRAVRMGDQLVQAVGVAEVATDPDHQGKGIATTLMTDAIAVAKNSLADFLILFGDEPLYARLGFQSKPNRTLTVSMHDVRTGVQESRCDDGLMVMALNDKAWDDTALIDLVGFAF